MFIYCFKNIYMAFKCVINPTANWIIYRKSIFSYRPLVIWIDYSLNKNQTICAWDTPYYEHVKHTLFDFYLNQHSFRKNIYLRWKVDRKRANTVLVLFSTVDGIIGCSTTIFDQYLFNIHCIYLNKKNENMKKLFIFIHLNWVRKANKKNYDIYSPRQMGYQDDLLHWYLLRRQSTIQHKPHNLHRT